MHRLVGFAIILFCIFGGFVIIGGNLRLLWKPMEMVIIFGAGIGALIVGTTLSNLKLMTGQLKQIFKANSYNKAFYQELLSLNYELTRLKRMASGTKVLEGHVEDHQDSTIFAKYPLVMQHNTLINFIVDNYRMTIAGSISAHELEATLEGEIDVITEELMGPASSLNKLGDALPGFGVLGAVMGIILTMQSIDAEIAMIGVNIATALVGTFLGIFGCYCLCAPLSSALKGNTQKSMVPFEVVKQILVAHVAGKSPLLCADAGRRVIQLEEKPEFRVIETWTTELDQA